MTWIAQRIKAIIFTILVYIFIGFLINAFIKIFNAGKSDEKKLKDLEDRRSEYLEDKRVAESKAKKINLAARIVLGVSILYANYLYIVHSNMEIAHGFQEILSFNEAIIISYSFVALVIAGTPKKFVSMINNIILNLCLFAHVRNYDIESIESNIQKLKDKIEKESTSYNYQTN